MRLMMQGYDKFYFSRKVSRNTFSTIFYEWFSKKNVAYVKTY